MFYFQSTVISATLYPRQWNTALLAAKMPFCFGTAFNELLKKILTLIHIPYVTFNDHLLMKCPLVCLLYRTAHSVENAHARAQCRTNDCFKYTFQVYGFSSEEVHTRLVPHIDEMLILNNLLNNFGSFF